MITEDAEGFQEPTEIRLRDGRVFRIRDLLQHVDFPRTINLRTGVQQRGPTNSIYTREQRLFFALEPIETIMQEFDIPYRRAYGLKRSSRLLYGLSTRAQS